LGRRKEEMARARDVEVEIRFLPSAEGGRSGPAFSGYRPQFFYAGHDWDAVHEYPDVAQVNPGDTVRAFLAFLSPHEHVGKLHPGMSFEIREGARTIGIGRVLRIIELEDSARRVAGGDFSGIHGRGPTSR
jgi:translation elongation factor EF-Tu-like GTPase